MHIIQQKLLKLAGSQNLGGMKLRQIARLIGESHPQKIKHHLYQLEKGGFIKFDKRGGIIERTKSGAIEKTNLFSVPILGSANCGEATIFADESLEGYLKVSGKLLKKKEGIFAIKAKGHSMNRANIDGKTIDDGDYVILDSRSKVPNNGDYVVSIIDDVANIKKFIFDKKNNQIVLLSESTEKFPPIYIHPKDFSTYIIGGKVVQVIKKPAVNWVG